MARILVVEDEPSLALGLQEDLSIEGYDVEVARDGETALQRALAGSFDLIILDVMLPKKDGFEVCRQLRREGARVPILMLTAKIQESDKVLGLEIGADDYVTKPFSGRELRARIKAREIYERIVREHGDQAAAADEARARLATLTGAGGVPTGSGLAVRRVWAGAHATGRVSSDGRFLSFTDWSTGDLAIRDLATGQNRPLAGTGHLAGSAGWAEYSVPSPDNKNVAYAWNSDGWYNLSVVGFDGSKPRVLRAAGNGVLNILPLAWSPDSRQLLIEFGKADGTLDLMLMAVADGTAKLLKAVGKNPSPGGVFSPDGRYIAWATKDGISLWTGIWCWQFAEPRARRRAGRGQAGDSPFVLRQFRR